MRICNVVIRERAFPPFRAEDPKTSVDQRGDEPSVLALEGAQVVVDERDAAADIVTVPDDHDLFGFGARRRLVSAEDGQNLDGRGVVAEGRGGRAARDDEQKCDQGGAARESVGGHAAYHGLGAPDPQTAMPRLFVFATSSFLLASALVAQEAVFVHRVAGHEAARTKITRTGDVLRAESVGSGVGDGIRVVSSIEADATGRVKQYDRELRNKGTLIGRVSVRVSDDGVRIRESGPQGSRTFSVPGGAFEAVVDAAFPEALLDALSDRKRTSIRALIVAESEIRTVLVETRGESARYLELPGGGMTVRYDSSGVVSFSLPGEERREILRADTASRPALAPEAGVEERFVVESGSGVKLGATLLRPSKPAAEPRIVLLLGDAGPTDRDGVGGGRHAPVLRLLAEELARQGIASVRADKRGAGESLGPEAGLAELAGDGKAVLRRAQRMVGAESRRTAIIGHGEGAVIAAEAAAVELEGIGGLVTLAGPGRPLADALEVRLRARLAAAGEAEDDIESEAQELRREMERLREVPASGESFPRGKKLLRDLAGLDPAMQLTKVRVPILVVHAAEDAEVPPAHVALLRAALAFSQRRVRFHAIDRADHDFLLVSEGRAAVRSAPGSADAARRLHPSVGALIVDFLSTDG